MNPTKTSLCMLLAAALGSAATATTLWELQKRDPLYQLTRSKDAREAISTQGLPRDYTVPSEPLRVTIADRLFNGKEEIYDAAIKARGEAHYIREFVNKEPVAYTTYAAQQLYHKALSRLIPAIPDVKAVVNKTFDLFGEERLTDGTPVIDYRRAHQAMDYAFKKCPEPYDGLNLR